MDSLPVKFGRQRPKPSSAHNDRQPLPSAYVSLWFNCEQEFDLYPLDKCTANDDIQKRNISFCGTDLSAQLYELKEKFKDIPSSQFKRSRSFTNHFETLAKGPFLNRSALKLVEINALSDLFLNLEKDTPGFTWVDVCGAPGGFSEYIVWWHQSRSRPHHGWGMTLRDPTCDWQVDLGESFTVIYGEDDTGNCYHEGNLRHLASLVNANEPTGVDLVLGDGGFAGARDIHDQEAAMARLILCQMAAMALTLKKNGTWVCKFFDMHAPFTAALYGLAARVFRRVCILKPLTSRPASAERYVVAEGFHKPDGLVDHLLAINRCFDSGNTQLPLPIPVDALIFDTALRIHLREVNDELLKRQITACSLIVSHANGKRVKIRQLSREERVNIARDWGISMDDNNE